jgi:hypothetical protein
MIVGGDVAGSHTQESSRYSDRSTTGSRYTGASLSYQLSSAIGGGFAPLIATSLLIAGNGSIVPLNVVIGLICLASAIAVLASYKAARRDPAGRAAAAATDDRREKESTA